MDNGLKKYIENVAHDATIGAGNDSEDVDYAKLEEVLDRPATDDEKRLFKQEWQRCLQMMAQP